MATPLIFNPEACQALRQYAEAHPLGVEQFKEMQAGNASWISNYWIQLPHKDTPISYTVGLTIEEHPHKTGGDPLWLMHFSFMSPRPGRVITPLAIDMLLKDFYPGLKCTMAIDELWGTYAGGENKGKCFVDLWFVHEKSKEAFEKCQAEQGKGTE